MLNTIYTRSSTFVLMATFALPLQAQSAPPEGCYERNYSQDHLGKNPDQVVKQIALRFGENADEVVALMSVLTADQGHARVNGNGSKLFEQFLMCSAPSSASENWTCNVECDGGSLQLIQTDGQTLKFSTQYLLVGKSDECGGSVDLAEKMDQSVTHKLTRVPDDQCAIN